MLLSSSEISVPKGRPERILNSKCLIDSYIVIQGSSMLL